MNNNHQWLHNVIASLDEHGRFPLSPHDRPRLLEIAEQLTPGRTRSFAPSDLAPIARYFNVPVSEVTMEMIERYEAEMDAIDAQPGLDAELREQEIMVSNHWGEE